MNRQPANRSIHPVPLLVLSLFVLGTITTADAATRYVEQWGVATSVCTKTSPCALIEDALDAANDGDKIVVGPGTYVENLTISKARLKLESTSGRHATLIESSDNSTVLNVTAPQVQIGKKGKGFTIHGATGGGAAAIRVDVINESPRLRIMGNRLGIPHEPGTNDDFANNTGLRILNGGRKIQIRNNIIMNSASEGLLCLDCEGALIRDNRIEQNVSEGIRLENSRLVSILRNLISRNTSEGIYIADTTSDAHKIRENVIEWNNYGLTSQNSDGSRVEKNIASSNSSPGLEVNIDTQNKAATFANNLGASNGVGFWLRTAEALKVQNNLAVGNNTDGFLIEDTLALGALKNNASFGNGNCGIRSDAALPQTNVKFFAQLNGVNDLCDSGDFPAAGPPANKPVSPSIKAAAKVIGG